jgi:RND family efflux transporter MFP subunit
MKIVLLPAILALILSGCARQEPAAQASAAAKTSDPVEIKTASAEQRVVEKAISVTGSLLPDEIVTVSSEVGGRVARIYADFGQSVRKGQVVAELDPREYEWQLERASAALAQALARLGMSPGEEVNPPKSTAAIRQMEAQMEDARSKYENASRLVKTGDISQERFTELEKAYIARRAALDVVRDDMRTVWANVQAIKAEIKLAEKRRNDATVRAPFDGIVSQRAVSEGQFLRENTPILTLVKNYPLRLRLEIPESEAAAVKPGTMLSFTNDAFPGRQFQAVVRELNPTLDARARTLSAEARLVPENTLLRPGMFVQVRLVTAPRTVVTAVPREALYQVAGLTKIFTIDSGRAKEHRILAGQDVGGGWIEIPGAEIKPGDRVAVSRLPMLTEGIQVR